VHRWRRPSRIARRWLIVWCIEFSMTALARCQAGMTKPSLETGLAAADAVVLLEGGRVMQGADLTACTHPHRGVVCACHRKDAHSLPAHGLNALTTRPVWSRLSRSHPDAAWSELKRSSYRAVFVRLTLPLVVQEIAAAGRNFSAPLRLIFSSYPPRRGSRILRSRLMALSMHAPRSVTG